jgi:hypothetical protein
MTLTRTRTRVYKYIILVNTVGAIVGAELSYLYFIDIKQLLNASKWRCHQTNKLRHQTTSNLFYIFGN